MSKEFVTEHVSAWINSDSDHYGAAMVFAQAGDLESLAEYCLHVIRGAEKPSAPWQVWHQHSPAELDSVDWAEVASDLTTE